MQLPFVIDRIQVVSVLFSLCLFLFIFAW